MSLLQTLLHGEQQQFFAIMTAHPLVGIFGSTYSIVFGAFLFLVPFLMKKPLWSIPLANWTCGLLGIGTFVFWFAGFLTEYAPLYTLYWPLLADFTQFSVWGGTFFITGIALITQGLAFFITLVTLWSARPLKMSHPLKFLLGGLLGFALAVPAGIMQADLGLNRILHNTQWIVGPHVHVAVLIGLTMTLYSAIYLLFPIVTNGAKLYSEKLAVFHFWAHLLGGIGMGAFMGMAGLNGMLRRSIYVNGEFNVYMILAAFSGALLLVAFLAFFYNIVMSLGIKGVLGVFTPSKLETKDPLPQQ